MIAELTTSWMIIRILIIVVISVAPYLTNKGEHTVLYKINNNLYIKTSKGINYIVIILYFSHAHARTHARTQKECNEE